MLIIIIIIIIIIVLFVEKLTGNYIFVPLFPPAGSNTSTVALRAIGGDENWTQYLGV
jgi:hypothetical protein